MAMVVGNVEAGRWGRDGGGHGTRSARVGVARWWQVVVTKWWSHRGIRLTVAEGTRWWGTWPVRSAGVEDSRYWQVGLVRRWEQVVVGI